MEFLLGSGWTVSGLSLVLSLSLSHSLSLSLSFFLCFYVSVFVATWGHKTNRLCVREHVFVCFWERERDTHKDAEGQEFTSTSSPSLPCLVELSLSLSFLYLSLSLTFSCMSLSVLSTYIGPATDTLAWLSSVKFHTHSLTHSLTYLLAHTLPLSFIHSFIHPSIS